MYTKEDFCQSKKKIKEGIVKINNLMMTLLVVKEEMFISTISSKGDSCNTESREHGFEVGTL